MAIKKEPVDVVIVGFGWTGSLMAMELADSGLKVPTPVAAIYSTNITPDSKTGIGGYTYLHALYDFFMHQVTAVKQENRASDIPWPLNMRWPLAMWNEMSLDGKRYQPDSSQSAEWNRGAYLVQGLARCGFFSLLLRCSR